MKTVSAAMVAAAITGAGATAYASTEGGAAGSEPRQRTCYPGQLCLVYDDAARGIVVVEQSAGQSPETLPQVHGSGRICNFTALPVMLLSEDVDRPLRVAGVECQKVEDIGIYKVVLFRDIDF